MDQNPNQNPAPPAGPTSAPAAGSGQVPERVKSVWQRGWLYPCIYGLGTLLAAAGFIVVIGGSVGMSRGRWIFVALLVVLAALTFTTGFRRKVTLTDDTLIVRNLFTKKTLQLHEITEIKMISTRAGFFARPTIYFHTANKRSADTMAFGSQNYLAVAVISEAAIAKGAKIIDFNAQREQWDPATGRVVPPPE